MERSFTSQEFSNVFGEALNNLRSGNLYNGEIKKEHTFGGPTIEFDAKLKELQDSADEASRYVNGLSQKIREADDDLYLYSEAIEDAKNKLSGLTSGSTEYMDVLNEKIEAERLYNETLDAKNTLEKELLAKKNEKLKFETKARQRESDISKSFSSSLSQIVDGFKQLGGIIMDFQNTWGRVDQAAANYTKSVGGSQASLDRIRKNTIDLVYNRHIGANFNTSAEELIGMQSKYNTSIGRKVELTGDQFEGLAAVKSLTDEQTAVDFIDKYEKFGLDATAAQEKVADIYKDASKSGIAFETYSKNFLNNIKLAQNYTFANGLKGLQNMAKKASEIKLDMQQVARVAERVSNVEGAIKTGASLSVLGGDFAAFSNPLAMMNEGLQDMEGLTDRVANMFGDMAQWNSSKGMIDISSFNKQRMRAAAEAMGVDYSSILDTAMAQGRRNRVQSQLVGTGLSDEMKELVANTGQLDQNGNAYVTIDNQKKYLNELTEEDKGALEKEQEENNKSLEGNVKDIAKAVRGWEEKREGFGKQLDNLKQEFFEGGLGKFISDVTTSLGRNNFLLGGILAAITGGKLFSALSNLGGSLRGGFRNFGRLFKNFRGGTPGGVTPPSGGPTGGGATGGATSGRNAFSQAARNIKAGSLKASRSIASVTKSAGGGVKGLSAGTKAASSLKALKAGGVTAGIVSGVLTGYEEFGGENKNRDTTSQKVGKTAGSAIGGGLGAWGGAALGAAIGTAILPGIGTAIGGLIGGMAGGWGGSEAGNALGGLVGGTKEEKIEIAKKNGLGFLKGLDKNAYTTDEIQEMIDNSVSKSTADKLIENGDYEEFSVRKGRPSYANGHIPSDSVLPKYNLGRIPSNGDNVDKNLPSYEQGGIKVAKGRSHKEGGIKANIGGQLSEIEGGEAVISKARTSQYLPELKAMNLGILPKMAAMSVVNPAMTGMLGVGANVLKSMKVKSRVDRASSNETTNSNLNVSLKPLDINIKGNINLNLSGQTTKININDLLDNAQFKREISKVIIKEMSNTLRKGNNKEDNFHVQFANKH